MVYNNRNINLIEFKLSSYMYLVVILIMCIHIMYNTYFLYKLLLIRRHYCLTNILIPFMNEYYFVFNFDICSEILIFFLCLFILCVHIYIYM